MSSFKDQYVATLSYNELFIADSIAENSSLPYSAHDMLGYATRIVQAIRTWEFDSRDTFTAHLEEYSDTLPSGCTFENAEGAELVVAEDLKQAMFDAFTEGIDFFITERLIED